jgi:tRNA threonylcarbamoyl adenosine modification protein YeaZ
MLLAIDTSAGTSVAIVDRELGVLAEASSDDPRRHAEVIGELLVACFDTSGVAVADLSGVVAGMGPGPFTGLRVGIAAARAFAFGAGKIVVPVASHDSLAFGEAGPLLVVTDARRNELFYSVYGVMDAAALPTRTLGPALHPAAELDHLAARYPDHTLVHARTVSAASLGLLAESLHAHGRPFAADEPLYLRSPDVTVSAGPKRVSG